MLCVPGFSGEGFLHLSAGDFDLSIESRVLGDFFLFGETGGKGDNEVKYLANSTDEGIDVIDGCGWSITDVGAVTVGEVVKVDVGTNACDSKLCKLLVAESLVLLESEPLLKTKGEATGCGVAGKDTACDRLRLTFNDPSVNWIDCLVGVFLVTVVGLRLVF